MSSMHSINMGLMFGLMLFMILCYHTKSQSSEAYEIHYPDEDTFTHLFSMAFDTDEDLFVCNIHVEDNTWAAIGFADSGTEQGKMAGVDSWVFGDFGSGVEVLEFALGDDNIGSQDAQQNLDYSIYPVSNGIYEVHIERALVTGTRDDYDIVNGGTLCILWAIGYDIYVENGHSNSTRGMQCFNLPGTTDAPTPTPTYLPTPAPSGSPTIRPTQFPTEVGGTFPPSPSPTDKPTTSPTTGTPTLAPTDPPTREPGSPTGPPTTKPTDSPTVDLDKTTPAPVTKMPTKSPTIFTDSVEETEPPEQNDNSESDDVEQIFLILFIILGVLICLLLATIFYCYHRNRKIRQKKQQEKEEAYEKMENYRAEHGLDIPNNAAAVDADDEDDDNDNNYGKGGTVGSAAPSHKAGVHSDSSDDLEKDDELTDILNGKEPPAAYAAPGIGGGAAQAEKNRRQREKRGPKKRKYRKSDADDGGDDNDNDDNDDDDVISDMKATPGGPTPSKGGKFVDSDKQKREKIRKERQKRVTDRAKLTQDQTSESLRNAEKKKKNKDNKGNDNDGGDDDDYDYEAARREREERKRRREARRKRAKKETRKIWCI